jgi:TorA maturation chaperone TorD
LDINEYVLFERKRGDCYKLLSACFYLPKKEIYLEEKVFEALTSLLNTLCPEATIFSAAMEEAIRKYSNEDLAVEYARLFVGPYELKAPPYGSVYLDGERRVMGNSTMEVIRLYEEAGLVMDKDFKELPDHIAVELEFMYYLIHKEVEALEKSEKDKALVIGETRNHFFNRFLSPWVPAFCKKMKESTDNLFYIALADCLSTFIANQSRD